MDSSILEVAVHLVPNLLVRAPSWETSEAGRTMTTVTFVFDLNERLTGLDEW